MVCKGLLDRFFLHIDDTGGDKDSAGLQMTICLTGQHDDNGSQDVSHYDIIDTDAGLLLQGFIINDIFTSTKIIKIILLNHQLGSMIQLMMLKI